MAVVALGDLVYAMIGRVRSYTELTDLVSSAAGWKGTGSGPRISGEIRGGENGWKLPTRAVVLREAGGPAIGDDYTMGIMHTRIQITCYGATGAEAREVWGLVHPILAPKTGERSAAFTLRGCRVSDIVPEVSGAALREPDTGWPFVTASYIVTWVSA